MFCEIVVMSVLKLSLPPHYENNYSRKIGSRETEMTVASFNQAIQKLSA